MRYSLLSSKKRQRTLFFLFLLLWAVSLVGLFHAFYTTNAQAQPAEGGQITEGMVGVLRDSYNFNPLFATGIEKDVSNLLFLGLMRYNPKTGQIEDYMATHDISPDKKTYTFTLKENLKWHDGQPITANDILFTYRDVIQNEEFPGTLLKKTFEDVKIEKKDERTVSFTIPEKRKSFFTNFTLGILPRHQLINIPVSKLVSAPFNQNPVGSGPYRFEEVFQEPNKISIRFSAFPDYFLGRPKIDTITFFVYPTIDALLPHISEFDSIRPMQTRIINILPKVSHFTKVETITPRYLAVFFNLKDETLTTKKVRQAMRAAVDTNALAEEFFGERVDTPLVELWPQNDIVNISKERAIELLEEAGYMLEEEREAKKEAEEEEKREEEKNAEQSSPEDTTPQNDSSREQGDTSLSASTPPQEELARYVYEPTTKKEATISKTDFYLVGNVPEGTASVSVNGYRLRLFSAQKKRFSYHASLSLSTLRYGKNIYTIRFYDAKNTLLDEEVIVLTIPSPSASLLLPSAFAAESEQAIEEKKYRTNEEGEHITLSLSYLETFDYLEKIAKRLQKEWESIGIEITLLPLSPEEMRKTMEERTYELLLLPQFLDYNLDAYPYFHLSQAKKGGFNVANWKNLKASLLLEEIRATHDPKKRRDALLQLRDIIIDDVPAIFLFTPRYTWLYDSKVKNVHVQHMVDAPDRYAHVNEFYIREARKYSHGNIFGDFLSWLMRRTHELFSFL